MSEQDANDGPLREQGSQQKNTFVLLLAWLGRIMAAVSLIKLIWHGLDWGPSVAGALLLEWHHATTLVLFGWLEEPIKSVLAYVYNLGFPRLILHDHWRDILVLLIAYFGARVRAMSLFGRQVRLVFWGPLLLLGIALALVGSVAAGTMSLESQPHRLPSDVLLALYPLLAVLAFDAAEILLSAIMRRKEVAALLPDPDAPWHVCFVHLLRKVIGRFVVAFTITGAFAICLQFLPEFPAPGLVLLVILLLLTSVYWLVQGAQTVAGRQKPHESWWVTYFRLGSTRNGIEIAYWVAGVLVFALLNAGLKLVGL